MKVIAILKNTSRVKVDTIYNGRQYVIKPKSTLSFYEKDDEAAQYLLETYGFLVKLPIKKN